MTDMNPEHFKLAVYRTPGYRSHVRIEEVYQWAVKRRIETVFIDNDSLHHVPWHQIGAIWFPMDQIGNFRGEIPEGVKTVIDYDSPVQDESISRVVRDRPVALVRAFSAFRPQELNIVLESFYWHAPVHFSRKSSRDVIIIDTNHFHPSQDHARVLYLLAFLESHYEKLCSITGESIKFYFTGLIHLRPYQDAINALSAAFPNCGRFDMISQHLIPPQERRSDFENLLGRCRLFITDQPDLADIGLFEVVMNNIPVFVLGNDFWGGTGRGITYSMDILVNELEPRFHGWLQSINNELAVIAPESLDAFLCRDPSDITGSRLAQDIFHRCWDDIWQWAIEDEIRPEYGCLMALDRLRRITTEKQLQEQFSLIPPGSVIGFFGVSGRFLKIKKFLNNDLDHDFLLLDNSTQKWTQSVDGMPIMSPDSIADSTPHTIFITTFQSSEVSKQLLELKNRFDINFEIVIVEDLSE